MADRARTVLLLKRQSKLNLATREFDEYGDVVRDFRKELEIYAKDEQENLLPQVSGDYFYSFHTYHLYRKSNEAVAPKVRVIPQLSRTKVLKKQSIITRITAFRPSLPKFALAFRSLW